MGNEILTWLTSEGVTMASVLAFIAFVFWLGKKSNQWDTTGDEVETMRVKLDRLIEKLSELIGVVKGSDR